MFVWSRGQYGIIRFGNRPRSPLILTNKSRDNRPQLDIGKLLPNTPMSPRSKRQVRTIPTLTNESESEIGLLLAFLVFHTRPALGVEFEGFFPVFGVDGADSGGTHEEIACGENVVCPWDGEVGYDFADEGVEGRV
jgi:hypothetical protein